MISSRPSRGLFLLALLVAFNLQNSVPLLAQNAETTDFSNYQNTPVNSILDIYEQLSGKHLIRDANLNGVPPVSINATGVSKTEMLKMIEEALLLNGVAILPLDESNAKVITVGTNKNPRSEGVKLYANAADLPSSDQVVSYYMPLSYISPTEAQTIFTQNAPIHAYGAYVVAPSAQAVVLTENVSVIRQLIALKELIDVPPASVTSEFVQIKRADAEKVADLLTKLLDQKAAAAPGAAGEAAVPVSARMGNNAPLLNEHNLISGPAQIVAITRSNQLLIVTRPVNMPFLKQLIAQLDQPDIFMVPQNRPLKYVLAGDILPALEAALAQGKEEEEQIKKETPASSSNTANSNQAQSSTSSFSGGGGLNSSGTGAVSSITSPLQAPKENNAPTVVTIGKTRLLADNRSNSIIVFGSPDIVTRVFSMVDELDRKPLQVYLATVIGQLKVSEGEEFGIDILQKFQHIGQGGLASSQITGPGTTASAAVPEPRSLTSALGFPLPTGLTLYGAIGSTLNAYVRALETTNRFKVISRPSVYTTNNKLAVIASGTQIPVPGNITSGFTGSTTNLTTSASVQYQNVLLELQIVPLINASHEVTLQIRQTNNTQGDAQIIGGNSVPSILTQEINTEVTVPDKSTIVIGGLISDQTSRNTTGVPLLSDIPILGYLFKDTKKTKDRNELIIMIQPTVVETDADQIAVNEDEKQRTILGHEAVEAATGVSQSAPQLQPAPRAATSAADIRTPTYNSKVGTPAKKGEPTVTLTVKPSPPSATPTGSASGSVPTSSSAAPDVSNGQLPPYPSSSKTTP